MPEKITVWMYSTIFMSTIFCVIATAEEYPTTLEELELYETIHLVDDNATSDQVTSDSMLKQFNLHILHTKLACIKATGQQTFCHCISENIPADQEFANYVVAVSKTKDELNFEGLNEYYQQSIDLARSARDKCVKETS